MDTATIGNTPLQLCTYLSERYSCDILVKKEYYNLNKTSKDRPAWQMIQDAIQRKLLKPGYTIVEASSGNTGIGIAQLAQQLGFRSCIFVTKDCSPEKLSLMRQLGAQIIICANSNGIEDKESTQYQAARYAAHNPYSFFTDQYNNPQNPQSHYNTTGPEIWDQCSGDITHFFAGVGTGGTISGVGKYLKTKGCNIQVYGIEPYGSLLNHFKHYGTTPSKIVDMEKIDGIGRKFVPRTFDPNYVDDIFQVSREQTKACAHTYYQKTGILLGFSSAAVVAGLDYYLHRNKFSDQQRIVLLFADYGDRYMNSLYSTLETKKGVSHGQI